MPQSIYPQSFKTFAFLALAPELLGVRLYLFFQRLQNSNLFLGLSMETLLITHNFQRNMILSFVIEGFDYLAKGSLA